MKKIFILLYYCIILAANCCLHADEDTRFHRCAYEGERLAAEYFGIDGEICQRRFYEDDEKGRKTRVLIDDGRALSADDFEGVTRRYETVFHYQKYSPDQFESIEENLYLPALNQFHHLQTIDGNLSKSKVSKPMMKEAFFGGLRDKVDDVMHHVFDKSFLQFAGYYRDEASSGYYDTGVELNEKVRISIINGILYISKDMQHLLQQFSQVHGGNGIYYVFRPTEGWTRDLFSCAFAKVFKVSNSAPMLAELWKKMIQEMGGVEGGGRILHYAHSIGATDTRLARKYMTPEELKMIHVITLGSPTLILEDSEFGSAINYVSKRDGVAFFDPIRYVQGIVDQDSNICFIGSLWGIPLIDHVLEATTYSEIIERLGAKFVEEWGK